MLPKERKISRAIYPSGKPLFSLRGQFSKIAVFKAKNKTKFSFVISKKVARNAALRNKIRRIGYRTIAEVLKDVKDGLLVVFHIHSLPTELIKLAEDIKYLLVKTGTMVP